MMGIALKVAGWFVAMAGLIYAAAIMGQFLITRLMEGRPFHPFDSGTSRLAVISTVAAGVVVVIAGPLLWLTKLVVTVAFGLAGTPDEIKVRAATDIAAWSAIFLTGVFGPPVADAIFDRYGWSDGERASYGLFITILGALAYFGGLRIIRNARSKLDRPRRLG